jgi:hypothetical protein
VFFLTQKIGVSYGFKTHKFIAGLDLTAKLGVKKGD